MHGPPTGGGIVPPRPSDLPLLSRRYVVPDLAVDVDGLRALSATLDGVRSNLDATRRVVEAAREDVGSDVVYDALDSFQRRWDDGRSQIDKNMQAMQEILDESAQAYEQTDEELASGLRTSLKGG
jgi:hypothetical protein